MTNPSNLPPRTKKVECSVCGLADLCIPQGLSNEELANLDTMIKTKKRLERDDTLYHAGDAGAPIYAVSSGSFKTAIISADGTEQITGFFLPGELVGLDGIGGSAPASTAIALETSTACELPARELDRLCEVNHGLRQRMMQMVGKELSREQQMMMTLGQLSADQRLASFLLGLSKRFAERGFSPNEFNLSMSRHDLANYLGLAVETLSRLFRRFSDKKLLSVNQRNIKILDIDGLRNTAHSGCQTAR